MATVTRPSTPLPDPGDEMDAEQVRDWINNILTFLESTNIDEANVDLSSTDGIMGKSTAQTMTGKKSFESTNAAAAGIVEVAEFGLDPASGTAADNDGGRLVLYADDDAGTASDLVNLDWVLTDASTGSKDSEFRIRALVAGTMTEFLTAGATAAGVGRVAITGDMTVSDDVSLSSDSAVLNFGADSDISLTHVADTGLTMAGAHANGTNLQINNTASDGDSVIQFALGGTVQYSLGVEDGDSDKFVINYGTGALGAQPAIEITSGGATTVAGALTASSTLGVTGVTTVGGNIVSDTDSTDDLGTTSVRWANVYTDAVGDSGQTLGVKATTLSFDAASTIDTSGNNALSLDAGSAVLTLDGGTLESDASTFSFDAAATIDTSGNNALTLDAGSAVLTLDGGTLESDATTLSFDGAASIDTSGNNALSLDAGSAVLTLDGGTLESDASTFSFDAAASIDTSGNNALSLDAGSAVLTLDGGTIESDASTFSFDSAATIDTSGNNNLTLSAGTATVVVTAGTLDVNGAADISGDLTLSAGGDGALQFSAASSVKMLDNSATSLVFEEADNAYMTFVTSNSSEAVKFDKALDINAAMQIDSTVTVGVDDTGHDVKFFGASSGAFMLYDESADTLEVRGPSADATTSTGKLKLTTALTDINDNDVLGRIDFAAPLEAGGTDAILAGGAIWGEAEATFTSSVNSTALVFGTNTSAAATERLRIKSDGKIQLGASLQIDPTIGSLDRYNGDADGYGWTVNYRGYEGGTSYFRDFLIADGKETTLVYVDGSAGKVGINITDPEDYSDASGTTLVVGNTAGTPTRSGVSIITDTSGIGRLAFGDGNGDPDQWRGLIQYTHGTSNAMGFACDGQAIQMTFVGGKLGIGNQAPNGYITIDQKTDDGECFTLDSTGDVAHGCTGITDTQTYFNVKKANGDKGGARVMGFAESTQNQTLVYHSIGGEDTTDTSSSDTGQYHYCAKISGTSQASFADAGNMWGVSNNGVLRLLLKGDGDMHITNTTLTALDEEDDIGLVRAFQKASSKGVGVVMSKWDEVMKENEEDLRRVGVLSSQSDFVIQQNFNSLIGGSVWQLYTKLQETKELYEDKLAALEQRLLRLEA